MALGAPAIARKYWVAFTVWHTLAGRRVPHLSPRRLQRLQERRIGQIVAHAYRTVPFYRHAMDERGLRPRDIRTAGDLARLPLLTGAELAGHPEQFVSTAAAAAPALEVWSSGSSGHAKRVLWDRAAVFRVHASTLRHREVMARFLGRMRGYRTLVVDRPGGTRDRLLAFLAEHAGLRAGLGITMRRASLADAFEHNVEVINAFRPDVISGFSGYLGAMFRWARAHGRRVVHPRLIWCGGEILPEPDRDLLERELGIPVIQSYQSCEFLRIAFQCERREGFHINVDQVAVRVVDASGAPVPPGTRGRLVVSGLLNHATVLLNYALGDLGVLAEAPCGCGRTLPMLAAVDGREDDFLVRSDGRVVHTSVVISGLYAVPGVVRLQLVQETPARFQMRVVCAAGADWTAARLALERALASVMGTGELSVEIAQVPDIAPEPSGKVRLVISRAPRLPDAG